MAGSILRRSYPLFAAAAVMLAACGGDDDAAEAELGDDVVMSIADPWSRQPAAGQFATAGYGIVSNPSDTDVTIVSASTPITDRVELHDIVMDDDGMMMMFEVDEGFVVPAGGEFVFEPGGPHIMFLQIDPETYPDSFEVTLEFDVAEPLTFVTEVRMLDDDKHGDHSHDDQGVHPEDTHGDHDMHDDD